MSKKLFVWTEVLCDWTCGIAFGIADTKEEVIDELMRTGQIYFRDSLEGEPKVYELPGLELNKVIAYAIYGGG